MREFKLYLRQQKYGPNDADTDEVVIEHDNGKMESETPAEATKLAYVPGIIVKLKLVEPCSDVKKLKVFNSHFAQNSPHLPSGNFHCRTTSNV